MHRLFSSFQLFVSSFVGICLDSFRIFGATKEDEDRATASWRPRSPNGALGVYSCEHQVPHSTPSDLEMNRYVQYILEAKARTMGCWSWNVTGNAGGGRVTRACMQTCAVDKLQVAVC